MSSQDKTTKPERPGYVEGIESGRRDTIIAALVALVVSCAVSAFVAWVNNV